MKKYHIEIQTYNEASVVESNCNDITFENKGSNPAMVNGYTLYYGDRYKPTDPQPNEMDVTDYNVSFTGAGSSALVVTRKIYR